MTNSLLMSKGIFIMILLFFFGSSATAQLVANFEWVNTPGGLRSDQAYNVCTDQSGNVYTTGSFAGTVDFDPGAGTTNLVSAGTNLIYGDVFITKTAPNGSLLWAKSIGSPFSDAGNNVVVDNYGHLYVLGWFADVVDFNPGPGVSTLTSTTSRNLFLMKMDTAGNFIWAKRMGPAGYNHFQSLMIDPSSGNLVMSGTFNGTADFGTLNITSAGNYDIFIAKADTAGNFIWAKAMGGTTAENQVGNLSGIDPAGNIYVDGWFRTTVDFDPGPGVFNLTSAGSYDGFVAKFNAVGNFIWAKQFGSTGVDQVNAVVVDQSGHLYCTGTFANTMDADPNAGVSNLISNGNLDLFVIKLDTSGAFIWAKNIGGSGYEGAAGLALDNSQHLYISGGYEGSIDVNPGAGVNTLSGTESFLVKLDSAANFVWGINMANSGGSYITVDNNDNVYAAYTYTGTYDFDHGPGVYNRTSAGENDIYLLKLNQNCSSTNSIVTTACDSLTLNGYTYTATGSYTQTLNNSNATGCDSIINITLTVNHSFDSLTTVSACGSYSFSGTAYTTSGIYTHTYSSVTGCDSLMRIDLTIFNTIQGDTVRITACDTFVFNGQGYNSSGLYTHTLPVSTGCDSLVTLQLTINTTDATVTQSGTTLTANTADADYQWLNCNNGKTPVNGAQSRTFNSNIDGSYAVVVTKNGCSDTSACYTVEHTTGINESGKNDRFNLYPNPTNGHITLDLHYKVSNIALYLYNAVGQLLQSRETFSGISSSFDLSACAPGIYYLKVSEAGSTAWVKVIKQ